MEALSIIQQAPQSKEHFVAQIDLQNLKKELSTKLKNELVDEDRSVKTTQIELQEAQAKIMEALSIIQQASQSSVYFVTQIDLQNLKKELSTDFKNELVDEIRKMYEEIANISKTPVNITQELHDLSTNLKKEIAEQLKGSREEVVKNTDKRLQKLQETTIMNINNDITILSKRYSTLDSNINEVSSETKGEMTVQIVDVKRKMESMEQAVDRQRKETREQVDYLPEDVAHKPAVHTQVLD
jgi:archaellum component FlaC